MAATAAFREVWTSVIVAVLSLFVVCCLLFVVCCLLFVECLLGDQGWCDCRVLCPRVLCR